MSRPGKRSKALSRLFLFCLLSGLALLVWWPLWFMVEGALMPLDELNATLGPVLAGGGGTAFWPLLPSWPTLQPLAELLLDTPQFFVMFWNTCKLVFPTVLGQLLVGAPAAWAFSRFRFRGRRLLFTVYIVLMLMPFQVTMVPSYLVANGLGLIDVYKRQVSTCISRSGSPATGGKGACGSSAHSRRPRPAQTGAKRS